MALKYKYKTKDEIPAELQSLYVERDGAWILEAEGVVEKSKLEEFRTNNIALTNQLKRFEGIDPDAVRQLAEDKQKLLEERQLKAGEVDKVIEARLKTARAEWDKTHNVVVAERDALTGRLTAIQIDQAVVTEATKRGLRATALPDVTSRARTAFKLVNGVPQAFEADGQTARMGKDGADDFGRMGGCTGVRCTALIRGKCWRRCRWLRLRWGWQPVREESLPQGQLESHGTNEIAEIRSATCRTPQGVGVTGSQHKIKYHGKDSIGRHHHPRTVRRIRYPTDGGEIGFVPLWHRPGKS